MSLHKRFPVAIASAATSSDVFNTVGFDRVLIEAPGTYTVYVQGSQDGVTYSRLGLMTGASASVGQYLADFNAYNGTGIHECAVAANMNYVKLEIGTAASAAKTAYIHVINSI
jgi:hypothetical protein